MNNDFWDGELNWDRDKIPLKMNGTIQNKNICKMLYSLHTDASILQGAEEQAERILDANLLKGQHWWECWRPQH